jgi:hypothetical protein
MQSQCDSGCVDLKNNEEFCSISLVDTVILDQCANGLPQFEIKTYIFPAATSERQRNLICIFFGCFKSFTAQSILAGEKLVLFGRYVLNFYVGIVQ